jgi:hypothetical protein
MVPCVRADTALIAELVLGPLPLGAVPLESDRGWERPARGTVGARRPAIERGAGDLERVRGRLLPGGQRGDEGREANTTRVRRASGASRANVTDVTSGGYPAR